MKLNVRQSHTFNQLYPPEASLEPQIHALRQWWGAEGHKAIEAISQHIGLTFAEQEIPAYIHNGPPGASSDPINISVKCELPLEHILIHELIHHLLSFNQQGYDEDRDSPPLYPDEEPSGAIHVIVHAIHEWYCLTHGQEDMIIRDIKSNKTLPAYARSWEIVQQEGYAKIIAKLKQAIAKGHIRNSK